MSEELTRLASIRDAKRKKLEAISAEQRAALVAAKQRVLAEFHDRMEAARYAYQDATQAFAVREREMLSAKTHRLEGKKVFKSVRKRQSYIMRDAQEFGIVEVRRTSSAPLAKNKSVFDTPRLGEVFVRHLKADGKPGLAFSKDLRGWKLVEAPEQEVVWHD